MHWIKVDVTGVRAVKEAHRPSGGLLQLPVAQATVEERCPKRAGGSRMGASGESSDRRTGRDCRGSASDWPKAVIFGSVGAPRCERGSRVLAETLSVNLCAHHAHHRPPFCVTYRSLALPPRVTADFPGGPAQATVRLCLRFRCLQTVKMPFAQSVVPASPAAPCSNALHSRPSKAAVFGSWLKKKFGEIICILGNAVHTTRHRSASSRLRHPCSPQSGCAEVNTLVRDWTDLRARRCHHHVAAVPIPTRD